MDNKEKYRQLCKKETSIPIFSRDWWLDVTAGEDNWDVVLVEKGGEIFASMPYMVTKRYIFTYLCQPILTQKLGPWIKYPPGQKYDRKLGYENEILKNLIEKLPKADIFSTCFDYSITNWLPFYWQGFEETTLYTYVIEDLIDIEKIFKEMSSDMRNMIRKAEKSVIVKESFDLELAYSLAQMTFDRQNMKIPYTLDMFKQISEACFAHNAGKIFIAEDSDGNQHGMSFMVYDENCAYYLIGGGNPEYRNSAAQDLLIWHMIKEAAKLTKKFDFEGTMLPMVNKTFRSFGTIQKSYHSVQKIYTKKYKISKLSQKFLQALME